MVPFSLFHLNHNQGDCPAPYSKCGMGPDQVNKARACPQMTMVTIILSIKDDDNDVDNDDNPLHDQGRTHCPHSLCLPLLPFPLHTCLWTRWFVIITIISSVQYRQSKTFYNTILCEYSFFFFQHTYSTLEDLTISPCGLH